MTTDPEEPARLHPAIAAPLLPFVLVYEAFRWCGRRVSATFPHVGRFLGWLFTPVRLLAEPVGRVLGWVGDGCRRMLSALGDAVGPAIRFLSAPLFWLGRGLSKLMWKLDHGVNRLWQLTSSFRLAVGRLADAALAPFRPLTQAARRLSAAVRTFAARVRRTFR